MSDRSPRSVSTDPHASTLLLTGRLSPVSADSAISMVAVRSSRPSAGTRSPASISTTSPGTSSSARRPLGGRAAGPPAPPHLGLDDHHLLQRADRGRRLALLVQAEHGVEQGEQD